MERSSTDRIEKRIELMAPVSRIWRALTDHNEFGEWFKVKLEAPFVTGQATRGRITYPGYEYLVMEVSVQKMEPKRLFSFHWHPGAVDANADYSKEPPTLVEFKLEPVGNGTLLLITESGFDAIPAARRDGAFRMNNGGWTEQVKNIEAYLTNNP